MSHSPCAPSPAPSQKSMTTALPILPRGQRPKLSVNTSTPRSFGKGASLRLDTLSAVSPTKVNTFSNAYPAIERPSKPVLSINSSVPNATSASTTPSSASTLSSALTSASSQESATISIPYKQPHNLASILTNSPARSIIPRKMTSSRPMFPAEKRVSFRTPLEEEITNVKYILAHSDLESSASTLSTLTSSESSSSDSNASPSSTLSKNETSTTSLSISPKPLSTFSSVDSSPRPKQPRTGEKRDSSSSEDESDTCPETPVAGRRKRTRDWRWTLPTSPGSTKPASSTTSDATTSEDSS